MEISITDSMVIGTSAITNTEIDGAVGMYSDIFNNPFIIWGNIKKDCSKLPRRSRFNFIILKWTVLMQVPFWNAFRMKLIYLNDSVLLKWLNNNYNLKHMN